MQLFNNCSEVCIVCSCSGGCLAGHGDDDFSPASVEELIKRYNDEKQSKGNKTYIKEYLLSYYGVNIGG